jgi:hypothetical protein
MHQFNPWVFGDVCIVGLYATIIARIVHKHDNGNFPTKITKLKAN